MNTYTTTICLCLALNFNLVVYAQPPELSVDDYFSMINAMAAQEFEFDFDGEFIQITENPPLSEDEIKARIQRLGIERNLENPLELEDFQSLYDHYSKNHLRVRKMRVWSIGDFQRIDQITGLLEDYEQVMHTPYERGLTLVNNGNDAGYYIDHRGNGYISKPGKMFRDESELHYFVRPFSMVNALVSHFDRIDADVAHTKEISRIIADDESYQDVIDIYFPENEVRYNLKIKWSDQELIVDSFSFTLQGEIGFSFDLKDYEWNEEFARLLPRYLEVVTLSSDEAQEYVKKNFEALHIQTVSGDHPIREIDDFLSTYVDLEAAHDTEGDEQ